MPFWIRCDIPPFVLRILQLHLLIINNKPFLLVEPIVPAKLIDGKAPSKREIGYIAEHQQRIFLFAVIDDFAVDGDFSIGQFGSLLSGVFAVVHFPQIFIEIALVFVDNQTGVRSPVSL